MLDPLEPEFPDRMTESNEGIPVPSHQRRCRGYWPVARTEHESDEISPELEDAFAGVEDASVNEIGSLERSVYTNNSTPQRPQSPPPSFEQSQSESQSSVEHGETHTEPSASSASAAAAAAAAAVAAAEAARKKHKKRGKSRGSSSRSSMVSQNHDGVFRNMMAKTTPSGDKEEQPPSYEQAAADIAPSYWETTIVTPNMSTDEVFIDGMSVGSVFAFGWNLLISVAFQFVGFFLTFILSTTHAARYGSLTGLGFTMIQFAFYLHDPKFDELPIGIPEEEIADAMTEYTVISAILMALGWFIVIRNIIKFIRVRRMEQYVMETPTTITVTPRTEPPDNVV